MIPYTLFDIETGRLLAYGIIQEEIFKKRSDMIFGNYDDAVFYKKGDDIICRPALQLNKNTLTADGVDELIIGDLPIPFRISIDDIVYEITDGELRFSTETPGIYFIKAETFPYKDDIIEIEAV